LVVKADGLAAGKGSIVCQTKSEAQKALEEMMLRNVFGEAGHRVVIEEFLEGEEISVLALSDGEHILPLVPSRDHKAAYDDDLGPNTGGMGAYAPSPFVDDYLMDEIRRTVLEPAIRGMAEEGTPYKGVLYAGLMLTKNGPKVIEFNCRFGDPETQVVLPLIESDLVEAMLASINGTLDTVPLHIRKGYAVCVVLASGGYPGNYEKGKPISGLEGPFEDDVVVFHAGTRRVDSSIVTSGGRVLGVTKIARTLKEAIDGAYRAVKKIHFDGVFYRKDIARKGLEYLTEHAK
jgi:phosphoribosylamine--glycine ligase